jgi:glycosyltransferase involved in cell wall biosynthesis
VLLVSPCQGIYGGMESFVLAVATALAADEKFSVRIAWKKVRSFRLDPHFEQMIAAAPVSSYFVERMSKELWQFIRWSDVVHCQNAPPDVVSMCLAGHRPVALTIHNWNRRRSFFDFSRCFSARLAARRWYNSAFVRGTWESGRISAVSAVVPTVSSLPQGVVPPALRRGFVFAARWIENKGLDILLAAYRRAALNPEQWPLFLLGTGPLYPRIKRELEDAPLPGVHLMGFVEDEKKAEIIRKSRWLVAPPHTMEDLGLTPIEARSVGVPSIITRDGGLPEAAGSQALICEPRDVEGLARLLKEAANMSESEYKRRAEACRKELESFLKPMSFYPDQFRVMGSRGVRDRLQQKIALSRNDSI